VTDEFRHYRRWFYAAAIYNAVWGSVVVLFPAALLRIADVKPPVQLISEKIAVAIPPSVLSRYVGEYEFSNGQG
jgi:hypothetical protein